MAQRTGKSLFTPVVMEKLDQTGILLSWHSVSSTNLSLKIFYYNNTWETGYCVFVFFFLNKMTESEKWRLLSLTMRGNMGYREVKLCNKNGGAQSSVILLSTNKTTDCNLQLLGSRKASLGVLGVNLPQVSCKRRWDTLPGGKTARWLQSLTRCHTSCPKQHGISCSTFTNLGPFVKMVLLGQRFQQKQCAELVPVSYMWWQ